VERGMLTQNSTDKRLATLASPLSRILSLARHLRNDAICGNGVVGFWVRKMIPLRFPGHVGGILRRTQAGLQS
jgi:hypothetical protein